MDVDEDALSRAKRRGASTASAEQWYPDGPATLEEVLNSNIEAVNTILAQTSQPGNGSQQQALHKLASEKNHRVFMLFRRGYL